MEDLQRFACSPKLVLRVNLSRNWSRGRWLTRQDGHNDAGQPIVVPKFGLSHVLGEELRHMTAPFGTFQAVVANWVFFDDLCGDLFSCVGLTS